MKKYFNLLAIALLSIGILSCGGENPGDDPSPEEQQLEKLAKTWTINSVTFNGSEDRSSDWSGFTLTVTGNKTYSTTSAFSPGPWPSSGSWDFAQSGDAVNINRVVRNDGLEISISVTESSLTLTFNYDDAVHSGGRTEAVNGEYVFSMGAN